MLQVLRRRIVTVPTVVLAFVISWGLAPAALILTLIVDVVRFVGARRPFMATRLLMFMLAYLTAEVVGLIALGASWAVTLARSAQLNRATFAIQRAWAGFLFWSVRRIFGIRVVVEGSEAVLPAPFIMVARHASIVDNLLGSHLVSRPHRIHLRYVMKTELLNDPALDVAGMRLPNYFVRRGGGESELEVSAIRELALTTGSSEAILIYPEGTRFSERKRDLAKARLARGGSRLGEIAQGFRNVIPPRLGGTLALLEGCAADVVVLAHRGLDGFARIADIWRGGMVRNLVEIKLWRIPRHLIPDGRSERAEWLFGVWQELDDWISTPIGVEV